MIDYILAAILILSAIVAPIWVILADKNPSTPKKKEENNGFAQDRP